MKKEDAESVINIGAKMLCPTPDENSLTKITENANASYYQGSGYVYIRNIVDLGEDGKMEIWSKGAMTTEIEQAVEVLNEQYEQ